mmetsp:Transcript_38885/g.28759  ORF Transcript_38885/g.28759 Transcript_38885/m.28759 type:complete len:173 (+) Transcript_38885:72-590(+)
MQSEKAIVVIRSPLDTFVSAFNQCLTGAHDRRIDDEDFKQNASVWADFCRNEISVWHEYYQFWQKVAIPVHFLRYEDLLMDPLGTLTGVMQFLLDKEKLEGTVIEKILHIVCGQKPPQMYQPRSGKFNANFDKFTDDQLKFFYQEAKDVIDWFGYSEIFTKEPLEEPKKNVE